MKQARGISFAFWVVVVVLLAACSQVTDNSTPEPPTAEPTSGIQGTVTDAAGAPVEGAEARFYQVATLSAAAFQDAQLEPAYRTTSDAGGVYRYPDAPAGIYNIVVEKDSESAAVLGLEVQENAAVEAPPVQPDAPGTISGSASLEGASSNEGVSVFIPGTSLGAYTDAAGAFTLIVPQGTYRVVAQAPGYELAAENDVAVASNGTTSIRLTLARPAVPPPPAPDIESLSPNPIDPGKVLTIEGENFGAVQASSSVRFGGILATEYPEWSESRIRVRVPTTVASGVVTVKVGVGNQEDSAELTVAPPALENAPPVADAGRDVEVRVGQPALLNGSGSSDPNGDSLSYSWSLAAPDGSDASDLLEDTRGANTRFTPDTAGTYTATLTVSDGEDSDSSSTDVVAREDRVSIFDQKLTASDASSRDIFGISVATSGDVIVVGAYNDDVDGWRSGSAYVFEKQEGGTWAEVQKLTASDSATGDGFGTSVSVSGDVIVIGATGDDDVVANSGSAYVFERRSDGGWVEVQELKASDAESDHGFGRSVSTSANFIVVGAVGDNDHVTDSGSVYVFERRSDGIWTEHQELKASDGANADYFGRTVATTGNTIIIGAHADDDNDKNSGSVYVYERQADGAWVEAQKLTASDGEYYDAFGYAVAASGSTLLVGTFSNDDNGYQSGFAYVFERQGDGAWREVQILTPSQRASRDYFGGSVSIGGNTMVIGSPGSGSSGAIYLFQRRADGSWTEVQRITASDGDPHDGLGNSVSMSGNVIVAGSTSDDDNGESSGSAYVYHLAEIQAP